MGKNQSTGVYIIVGIIALLLAVVAFAGPSTTSADLSYSEFVKKVKNNEIASVQIAGTTIAAIPHDAIVKPQGETQDGQKQTPSTSMIALSHMNAPATFQYKVQIPQNDDTIMPLLNKHGVDISVKKPQEGSFMGTLGSFLVPLFFIGLIIFLLRGIQQGGSSAMNFGKSRAKLMQESKVKITFSDVAGIDEEKQELEEIVDFLKNGEKYIKLGAKIPKGVLLVGVPGTGKTLMAKAVAGEAGVPFFSISGSDFVEMFVGVGASRVRDLFEQAKKHQPCIIFIDEIDAVGRQRGAGMGGGHDEREQTLNQLLVEMDGFDENTNIIILAATNRPDILDNALLRPGRFDRQIIINRPDILGREQILSVHAQNKPISSNVDLKVLAKRTPGFTGADLQNLLNEAALLSARYDKSEISMDHIEQAIDKVMAGPEKKSRIISDEEKENTAYHEVGHALLASLLEDCDPLHKVSIIPRGMALGITTVLPEKDHLTLKKSQILDRITMILGGRVAEELIYGAQSITTGAQNDLEKVSALARKMVMVYGMSEKMGNLAYGKSQEHVFMGRDFGHSRDYSDKIAAEIDNEVKAIVDNQYNEAKRILSENEDMLRKISKELLERETLDDVEFTEIMNKIKEQRNA